MKQLPQFLLVGLLCFALGAGALYGWTQYTTTRQENMQLKARLTASPAATAQANPKNSPTVTPTKQPVAQTGTITGTLGYPSEGIPPLEIFAINVDDQSFFKLATTQNQNSFTLTGIKPGNYTVVAYEAGGFSGGYTKAVACGLTVECKDHSLIQITVVAGQTASNVAIKDWYAPDGTFPARPE